MTLYRQHEISKRKNMADSRSLIAYFSRKGNNSLGGGSVGRAEKDLANWLKELGLI